MDQVPYVRTSNRLLYFARFMGILLGGYAVMCIFVLFLPLKIPVSANIPENALFIYVFNPFIIAFASVITPAMAEWYLETSLRIPLAPTVFVIVVTIDFTLWHAFGPNPSFWPLLIVGGLFAGLLNAMVLLHAKLRRVRNPIRFKIDLPRFRI